MDLAPPYAPVFNVCTGVPTSVRELAHLIGDLAGQAPRIEPRPARAGEIRHSLGVPVNADQALGLPPRTCLRDGLAEVLAWLNPARPSKPGPKRPAELDTAR